jgi:drug/metabolite transporter, DME family
LLAGHLRARAGLLAVSGGALLWGTTGVAVSITHQRTGLAAVTIGWYRLLVAAVAAAVLLGPRGWRAALGALRRHPVALPFAGIGFGAYQALYFVGVQDVGVSVSTLVSLGLAPVALTAGTALARRRRPGTGQLAVLVAALVGLVLISLAPDGSNAPHPLAGVLASIASGLGYAAITALGAGMAEEDPLVLTGTTSLIGALGLLPVVLVAGLAWPHDAIAGGWVVYIGVVPTVVAYWCFYRGLRSTSSEVAGVLSLLEPLCAAVLAALVLHEAMSGPAIAGALLMLGAVASLYLRPHPGLAGGSDRSVVPAPP